MFTSVICKRLVNLKSWGLITKNISLTANSLRCQCHKVFPELMKENDDFKLFRESEVLSKDIFLASKIVSQHNETEPIRWEEIIQRLKDSNVQNPQSALLQVILNFESVHYGVDFYSYLIKEGKQFTVLELMIFLKLFSFRKDLIMKNKTMIEYIYDNIKDYLLCSPVAQNFVLDVIAEVPHCFYDYVNTVSTLDFSKSKGPGILILIIKAFEKNRPDLALKLMNSNTFHVSSYFSKTYFDYLYRMAEKNKLSPDMITTLTNFYEKNLSAIDCDDLYSVLTDIFQCANNHNTNYFWSVSKCILKNDGVCLNCENRLVEKNISEAEFNFMRKDFLSQIALLDKNIYISTSVIELQKFFSFLKNCEPYDVVLDALNIIYKRKHNGLENLIRLTKHLVDEGLRVLIIGKKHIESKITNVNFIKKKYIGKKIQYFFLSNLSDDDVFILYATLHGGLGTNLVSGDNLSSYAARLSGEQKNIFLKWKIFHQYSFNGIDLIPPRRHLGVPQLTFESNENRKKFIWHLSSSPGKSKISISNPLKWVCVQAELRQNKN